MPRLGYFVLFSLIAAPIVGAEGGPVLDIRWDRVTQVSRTSPSLLVVANPLLRRGSPMHDAVFLALRDLGVRYARYVP
jgi:hypothetical protein